MRPLTAFVVACWLACTPGRPSERARAPASEVPAPAPGLTLFIARTVGFDDFHDSDSSRPVWPAATFIDHRFHVEPEPGGRAVRLTEQDFLDPAPRELQVFLMRPDGREEQLSSLSPTDAPSGAAVSAARPEAGQATAARFELPPDAGPRPLLRLLYRSRALHWSAFYSIVPADPGPAPTSGAFMLTVRGRFSIHNNTMRPLPEARVRLHDSPDRALRTHAAPASRPVFPAPVHEVRTTLTRTDRSTPIELSTHERPVPGRIEHVVRIADTGAMRVSRELPVEVRRELVLMPPPGHALHAAAPGLVRIMLGEGYPSFGQEGDMSFLEAEPSGTWRARMDLSPHVHATARVSVHRAPEGTYARYRLTASGREPSPDSVRVVAAVANAGMAELVSAEPAPVARDDRGLTFQLELAAPDRQALVEYLLFYPH